MSRLDLLVIGGMVVAILALVASAYALVVLAWTLVITGATFVAIGLAARWWVFGRVWWRDHAAGSDDPDAT